MTTSKHSEASYATLQRMRSSTAGGNELMVISDQLEQELLAMYSQDFEQFKMEVSLLLRENSNSWNMNDIGLVADHGQINEKQFSKFLDGILSKDLAAKIFSCFDKIDGLDGFVSLPAIHRFVTGRSKVGKREKEIDETWLLETLKHLNLGAIDLDGNDKIELSEFREYFRGLDHEIPEDLVDRVYAQIDANGDGHITPREYFVWRDGLHKTQLKDLMPAKVKTKRIGRKRSNSSLKNRNTAYSRSRSKSKPTIEEETAEEIVQQTNVSTVETHVITITTLELNIKQNKEKYDVQIAEMQDKWNASKAENERLLIIGESHDETGNKYESQIISLKNTQILMEKEMKEQQQTSTDVKNKEIAELNVTLQQVQQELNESEAKQQSAMEYAKEEMIGVQNATDIANKELLEVKADNARLQKELNDAQLAAENTRQEMVVVVQNHDVRYKEYQETVKSENTKNSEQSLVEKQELQKNIILLEKQHQLQNENYQSMQETNNQLEREKSEAIGKNAEYVQQIVQMENAMKHLKLEQENIHQTNVSTVQTHVITITNLELSMKKNNEKYEAQIAELRKRIQQTSVETRTVTITKVESDMRQNKEHYDVQTSGLQNTEEKERMIVGNEKLGASKHGNDLILQATIDQLRINLNRAQQEKEKDAAKEYLLRESFNKTYVILSKELHVPQQNLNEGNLKSYMHSWKSKNMQTSKVYDERSRSIISTTTTTKVSTSVNEEVKEIEYDRNKEIELLEDDKHLFSFSLFSKKFYFGNFGNDETDQRVIENEKTDGIFALNGKNEAKEEDSLSLLMLIAKDF